MAKAPAKATKKKSFKKKEKRVVHSGIVHIQATFNNTIVTIADQEGNVSWSSAGSLGFRGSRKGTPFAAQQAALDGGQQGQESGSAYGGSAGQRSRFGPRIGRARSFHGRHRSAPIKDVTPIPHNGCRPPKKRRV
jgi:small subunit ribosomal protein S11